MRKSNDICCETEPVVTDPLCVRVPEACRLISIGRSKLYDLIASGEIESIKIGTSTRIVTVSLRRLVSGDG